MSQKDTWTSKDPMLGSSWDKADMEWDDVSGTSEYLLSDLTWNGISFLELTPSWSLYNNGSSPTWVTQNSSSSSYTTSLQPHTTWEV